MNQRLWVAQKFRFRLIGPRAEISQNVTCNRRANNGNATENYEIHSDDPRRNGNKMPHDRQKPGEENSAGLVAIEPVFRLLHFLRGKQNEASQSQHEWPPDPSRNPI